MRLTDYRKLRRLSRAKAAADLKVSQQTVWRWETGRTMPGPVKLRAIAAWSAGAVTANDFVGVAS